MFTHPYIALIASYLLIGGVFGFLLELLLRLTDQDVTPMERFVLIVGWPALAIVFIINFIKGLFGND
tara:strand:- start:248 stop:448 length:201 start_codon:yes stop_codon:yes gene_type:complete